MRSIAAALIGFGLFLSPVLAQTPIDFSGSWWNDRCSKMDLTVTGEQLGGTYASAVGTGGGTPFPLVGYRSGIDLLAFTVNFGPVGSLASWAGQHTVERGTEKIITMWHVTANVADADENAKLWGSILTGSDTFYRTKPGHCP